MKRILSLAVPLAATLSVLSGCAGLQRSSRSGYAYRSPELSVSQDRKVYEKSRAANELGLSNTNDMNDDDAEAIELRAYLKRAEQHLEGRREREQYFKNRPQMSSDKERLQFLKLGSFDERQRWLDTKGIGSSSNYPAEIQSLIDQNDITLGMTRQAVRDAWGAPENVEVAGNPIYGNERWHYSEQITSSEGYQTERRVVYFEAGRVIGWEKE